MQLDIKNVLSIQVTWLFGQYDSEKKEQNLVLRTATWSLQTKEVRYDAV